MHETAAFFDGWDPVLRTAIVTPLAYGALVLFLRISGKRTLAQLNIFDWVVTVALGSALATVILSPEVALAQGLLGLGGLIALQFVLSFVTSRWERVRHVVTAEPVLLARDGELLREAMRRERVAESEVLQALRQEGHAALTGVGAIILETNGSMTVLPEGSRDAPTVPERNRAS